jgi:tRNA dimethylallyltransferase
VLEERETIRLLLLPERETMAARIEKRFDAMVQAGALQEVAGLVAMGLSRELPVMRALGVAPLAAYLAGAVSLEAAVNIAKADTRKYAKRQLTWLRRKMISWTPISQQQLERIDHFNLPFIDP